MFLHGKILMSSAIINKVHLDSYQNNFRLYETRMKKDTFRRKPGATMAALISVNIGNGLGQDTQRINSFEDRG